MGNRPLLYVAGEKRKRAIAVATSLFHFGRNSPVGCARATRFMERENRLRSSAGTRLVAIIVRNLTARPGKLTGITVGRPELRIAAFRSMQASASLATRFKPRRGATAPASGRVSGSSSQTRARPQAAMDARLKNATLLPK